MKLSDVTHISSGKFVSDGLWIHPKRNIDSCELIFVLSGEFEIQEADIVHSLTPDTILILDKNTPHGGISKKANISFFWVHFPGRPDNILLPKIKKLTNPANVLVLFRQLLYYSNSPQYPQMASDLILQLILTEINVQHISPDGCQIALVNEICEWIRINIHNNIVADDISRQFKYNKDYLSRLFKKAGLPGLKQTIIQTKIDKARYLLLSTDLPLKEIGLRIGFQNYIEFLKFFKYHENISPSIFRNHYSKTHLNNQ